MAQARLPVPGGFTVEPPKARTPRSVQVAARLPSEKAAAYRAAAERAGVSFTEWLEWGLDLALKYSPQKP